MRGAHTSNKVRAASPSTVTKIGADHDLYRASGIWSRPFRRVDQKLSLLLHTLPQQKNPLIRDIDQARKWASPSFKVTEFNVITSSTCYNLVALTLSIPHWSRKRSPKRLTLSYPIILTFDLSKIQQSRPLYQAWWPGLDLPLNYRAELRSAWVKKILLKPKMCTKSCTQSARKVCGIPNPELCRFIFPINFWNFIKGNNAQQLQDPDGFWTKSFPQVNRVFRAPSTKCPSGKVYRCTSFWLFWLLSLCDTGDTHARAHTQRERYTAFYLPLQVCIGVSSATVDRPAAT